MKNRAGRKLGSIFGKVVGRSKLQRALRGEMLENRSLMAADLYLPFHNDLIPEDTNQDFTVSALDALLVINALNTGTVGELEGPDIGKANGPLLDVSGDNSLSALDALQVINRLNGEGELPDANDIVGLTFDIADKNGNVITNNSVSVDQLFQLRAYARDLRGPGARGVFGAFLDLDYTNGDKFSVQVGETQSFRYFYDQISTTDSTSFFKFSFEGQTTANVPLFNGDQALSGEDVRVAVQAALEALPNVGAGNVLVRLDPVGTGEDDKAGLLRNNFDIQFVNSLAGRDVGLVTLDASGVKVKPGQQFVFSLVDKYPADPNNPQSFAAAFRFGTEFTTGRTATQGVNQFDEVGAAGGLVGPTSIGGRQLLFSVTLKALSTGSVTFTANEAEASPAHDTLVYPKNVVPRTNVSYGLPLTVNIVSDISAVNDTFSVAEDSASAPYNVVNNDTLLVGTSFTVTGVTTSANGVTPTIASGGSSVNYQPPANFFGTDTFTYTVTTNLGATSTATVTMTVTPVNDPISVPAQSLSTNLGRPVTRSTAQLTTGGSVGTNESSIQQLSISSVASPSQRGGVVSLNAGNVTYTPPAGFAGTDTFTIIVTDNGLTNGNPAPSTQTVTVTATVVNDAPDAVDDSIDTVDEDSTGNTLNVLANDSAGANDQGDTLTITRVGNSTTTLTTTNGSVTISQDRKSLSYTPNAGFVGLDTFNYTVTDSAGATDTATVTVDVQATVLPRARTETVTVNEDITTPFVIDVLDNDRTNNGSVPILLSKTDGANGTVTINDNGTPNDKSDDTLSYLPNPNFAGQDTFTYTINETPDTGGQNSTATVTVNVTQVNDAPVLVGDTVAGTEDTPQTISGATLTSNDSPGNAFESTQTLTVTSIEQVTSTASGTVTLNGGNIVFSPTSNFNGDFVFRYTATDNGTPALSSTATVTIAVAAVNDAPVAANDSQTTAEGSAAVIQATTLTTNDRPGPASATDEASQTLTIVSVNYTGTGSVVLGANGASVTYTPATDFVGNETFTYTIRDNGVPAREATATVTMTVTAVNDAPIAANDTQVAFKDNALTIGVSTLLTNDRPGPATATDETSQTLTITSVGGATNGSVSLQGSQIVFTPTAGYTGPASFTYTVQDNGQTNGVNDFKTATGTVNINVQQFVPSSISGIVYWDDDNSNGLTSTDNPIVGVNVTIVGTALGVPVGPFIAITDAHGVYNFDQLAPGTYTVTYTNPTSLTGPGFSSSNSKSYTTTINQPGGSDVTGFDFLLTGPSNGMTRYFDRLSIGYARDGVNLNQNGLYAAIDANGNSSWVSVLGGFSDIQFAEVSLTDDGRSALLTIVKNDGSVHTAVLGSGKFVVLPSTNGDMIIRIFEGEAQLASLFQPVSPGTTSTIKSSRYLDRIDAYFAQL